MFGRPTPTKQTRVPASSRAAATIIISDAEKSGITRTTEMARQPMGGQACSRLTRHRPLGFRSGSPIFAVVDGSGWRRCRAQREHARVAHLVDVLGTTG